jgi:hypothetical protein
MNHRFTRITNNSQPLESQARTHERTWTKNTTRTELASASAAGNPHLGRPPRRPLATCTRAGLCAGRRGAPAPLGCPRACRIRRDRGVRWERETWEEDRDENYWMRVKERDEGERPRVGGWRIIEELYACMQTEHWRCCVLYRGEVGPDTIMWCICTGWSHRPVQMSSHRDVSRPPPPHPICTGGKNNRYNFFLKKQSVQMKKSAQG